MLSGRQFHRSTMRLKNKNLKTLVLKRPFTSVASLFLMLYLGDLKFTYDKTSKSKEPLRHLKKKQRSNISLLYSKGKRFSLTSLSG